MFAVLLVTVGCAGGPADVPPPLTNPIIRATSFTSDAGPELAFTEWAPKGSPKAVILALHGFGDYGPSTFGMAAEDWAKRGIITYAYDQRGFGRNPSWRKWPGPKALIDDAVAVATALKAKHPDIPLTVVGHSMGGGVALAAAGSGLPADRLVLAAPAIAGGQEVGPVYRFGGWGIGFFFADRRFTGDGVVEIWPTDNIEALRRLARDPRNIGNPSGRELYGLVRIMDRAARAAPRVTLPTLTLMGAKDDLLPVDRIERVHGRIAGAEAFRVYPNGWHWLFRDLQAATVWSDVAEFALDER